MGKTFGEALQISTHTSRVGCDISAFNGFFAIPGFLLTHPVWDVTNNLLDNLKSGRFLLTHPVWDVTQTSSEATERR